MRQISLPMGKWTSNSEPLRNRWRFGGLEIRSTYNPGSGSELGHRTGYHIRGPQRRHTQGAGGASNEETTPSSNLKILRLLGSQDTTFADHRHATHKEQEAPATKRTLLSNLKILRLLGSQDTTFADHRDVTHKEQEGTATKKHLLQAISRFYDS